MGLDDCNVDTHNCQASQGSTLLTKIVFSSKGCEGCTTEGVNMTLAGDSIITPQPRCKTVDLDHPGQVDFAAKSTFIANAEEQNMGWENCWQVLQTQASLCWFLSLFYPGCSGGQN